MFGQLIDGPVLAVAGGGLACLLVVLLGRVPRLALVGWLAVLCFVPVWSGLTLHIFLEPQVLAGILLLAALFPLRRALPVRMTPADVVLAAFAGSALVPVVLGGATVSGVFALVVKWGFAFLAGRLIGHRLSLRWIYGAVAVFFTVVALLALVEWATGWNPFLAMPGNAALRAGWATVQLRGGVPRAEGAFGHSIALGASVALALPITLAAPFRPVIRAAMTAAMLAACAVTFSRIGFGTAVIGLLLSLLFLRTDLPARLRFWATAGLLLVAVALGPMLSTVFQDAGAEASASAAYRGDLLGLLRQVQVLGLSPSFQKTGTGDVFYGGYHSIDSALVLIGLSYGWIPLIFLLVGVVLAVGTVLRGRASAPVIAVVAQLPAFASVALITQYAGWAWFVIGLAVAAQALAGPRRLVPVPPRQSVTKPQRVEGSLDMLTAESSGSLHGGEGPGAGGAHGFLQALRRRGWAVVVCVVLACGTALGLSLTTTPTYTATAALYFSLEHGITANDLAQGATYTKDQMSSYATLATTPAVLRPVIDRLQLHTTPAALAGQVTASAAADTVVLDVAARSTSATQAADIANAVADQLTSSVEAVAPTDVNGHATVRVTPVTPATPPAAPSSPRTTLDLVAGLIAGLALGLLYVFLREALDTRVRDARRVQELTDAPVLGRIPAVGRDGGHVVVATAPRSLQSELFRQLRTNLEFLRAPGEPLTLVVTSSLPGEGKSTVAVNLALSLAEVSDRVLLIDADLRRPSVADRLDLEGAAGLSTVLVGRAEFDDVVQHWGEHGLDVLTSGALPPNPAQLLDSPRMVALLDMLGARYDVILIDTAPVLPVTDALLLSRCTQGTLVVADSRRVRRHQLAGALRQLATVQAPLLGVVLNRLAGGKQVYGYGTYDSPSPAGTDQSEPQRWSVPWPARGGRPSLPSPTSVEEPAPHTPGEPATTAARP